MIGYKWVTKIKNIMKNNETISRCYACSGCLLIVYFQIKRKSPVNDAFMGLFFYTCKTNYKEVDVQKMRINGCAFVQFFVFFLKTGNIVP